MQLFKTSFVIYKNNFKNIALAVLFVFVPFYIIIGFIPDNLLPASFDFLDSSQSNTIINYLYFIIALTIVFEPLIIGAISTVAFTWLRESRRVTIPEMLDNSLMKWAKLSITAFLFTAIILLTATLIIPAIFFSLSFSFYGIIAATSNKWGLRAFIESYGLMKGRWWHTAIKLLGIAAAAYMTEFALNMIVFAVEYPFLISVAANVLIKLVTSYFFIVSAVFCFNMIASKETPNVVK